MPRSIFNPFVRSNRSCRKDQHKHHSIGDQDRHQPKLMFQILRRWPPIRSTRLSLQSKLHQHIFGAQYPLGQPNHSPQCLHSCRKAQACAKDRRHHLANTSRQREAYLSYRQSQEAQQARQDQPICLERQIRYPSQSRENFCRSRLRRHTYKMYRFPTCFSTGSLQPSYRSRTAPEQLSNV